VDADGKVSECGIGMAGVALSYVRASKAEEYLVAVALDRDMLRRGSGIAAEETHPVSDTRRSAVYKREMVKVLWPPRPRDGRRASGFPLEVGVPLGQGRAGSHAMPWGRNEPEPAGTRCPKLGRGHR